MASVQANNIGINEIIGALPTLTLAEVKELVSMAKKSVTEHEQRDDIAQCEAILPTCNRVMAYLAVVHLLSLVCLIGSPSRSGRRAFITLWLYQEMCFTMPVIRKAMGKSWSQVTRAVEHAEDWAKYPRAYADELALYDAFKEGMDQELTHR